MAADRARDHRSREAQIRRHDGRQQRPPGDPREGAGGRPPGAGYCRAGSTAPKPATPAAPAATHPPITPETKPPLDAELQRPEALKPPPVANTEQARVAAYGPVGIPHREVGSCLHQAHRRHDGRAEERRRAGALGRPAVAQHCRQGLDRLVLSQRNLPQPRRTAGITYVDIWDGFVDEQGRYSAQGPDYEGQTRRLRTGDGVYFTKFGARKLAHYVEREIERHLANRTVPVALPVTAPPAEANPKGSPSGPAVAAKPSGPPPRPAAGPVLPLNGIPASSEELLGGGRAPARPASTDPTATRVLTKGEPVAPATGRADDFSWPRRNVADEPAAVTPAAITALSKPPTRMPGTGEPEPEPGSDAQKAADAKKAAEAAQKARQATQSAPQRSFFSPQQWFRGFGRW